MFSKYDDVISFVVRTENYRFIYIYIMFIWYMRIPHSALFVHHELDEATLGQVTRLAGQKG